MFRNHQKYLVDSAPINVATTTHPHSSGKYGDKENTTIVNWIFPNTWGLIGNAYPTIQKKLAHVLKTYSIDLYATDNQ